jgi:hypothetical protein
MVPHGDAQNRSHSGRIEDQVAVICRAEQNVVRVLVLNDHVVRNHERRARDSPSEGSLQRIEALCFRQKLGVVAGHASTVYSCERTLKTFPRMSAAQLHAAPDAAPLVPASRALYFSACGSAPVSSGPLARNVRMKSRSSAYVIAFLLAAVLALLPAAMWPDLFVPMADNWNNWYWEGQPHPRPNYSLQHPPALFRAELATFRALVEPPAYLRRALTGWPTAYATLWVSPYRETAGLPPLAFALEHLTWALPFWFVLFAAAHEVANAVRRRTSRMASA